MTIYTADKREADKNTIYPNTVKVDCLDDLLAASRFDMVPARFKWFKRGNDNFVAADLIEQDIDNTHSEEESDWKGVKDIAEAIPGVKFYFIHSRNSGKIKVYVGKNGQKTYFAPRTKGHVSFPLSRLIKNKEEYKRLILIACLLFPYFDGKCVDVAHFFFGVAEPRGEYIDGELFFDQFVDQLGEEELNRRITDNYRTFRERIEAGDFGENDGNGKMIKLFEDYLGISRETEHTTAEADEIAIPSDLSWLESHDQKKAIRWLTNWAKKYEIKLGKTYKISTSAHPQAIAFPVTCPWESSHSVDGGDKESVIIIERSGKLAYLCRHDHCMGKSWKDFRAEVENQKEENRKKDRDKDLTSPNDKKTGINLTRLSEVEEQEPDWLIDGYLARGEINILGGDGGSGKTFVWVAIAAAVSNGEQPAFITGCPFGSDRRNKA